MFEISKLLSNQNPVIIYYKEIEPKIYNNRNYNPVKSYAKILKTIIKNPEPEHKQILNRIYDQIRPDAYKPEIGDFHIWLNRNTEEFDEINQLYQAAQLLPQVERKIDTQNVHDHTLNNILSDQYNILKTLTAQRKPLDEYIDELKTLANTDEENIKIFKALKNLNEIKRVGFTQVTKLGGDTELDLVERVFAILPNEKRWPLIEALEDCDQPRVCTTGRVTRIFSSLAHQITERPDMGILLTKSAISDIANSTGAQYFDKVYQNTEFKTLYDKDLRNADEEVKFSTFKDQYVVNLQQLMTKYKDLISIAEQTEIVDNIIAGVF